MDRKWEIPESQHPLSLTVVNGTFYAAEYGGEINKYDLAGNFLGSFADVSSAAGPTPTVQRLESDLGGNLYTTFGGFHSEPRTSFRLDQAGNVTAALSHPQLVFPRGIDATAEGEIYILNSANAGIGNRLFKFDTDGQFLSSFAIPQAENPSDIAIDEVGGEVFIADEFGEAVLVYDVTTGVPVFQEAIPVPGYVLDVFFEPTTRTIFGAFFTQSMDAQGPFSRYTGFELSRTSGIIQLFEEAAPPREQTVRGIVAVVVPEPHLATMLFSSLTVIGGLRGRARHN